MAANLDLTIYQGATFEKNLTLKVADGTPFDLTGYTGRGQIRERHSSADVLGEFTIDIDADPTTGALTISMTAEDTADISVASALTLNRTYARYVYDIEIYKIDRVIRLIQGAVLVYPEVTREA
jgi:hypothetical protein